jgi:hypothetical protein
MTTMSLGLNGNSSAPSNKRTTLIISNLVDGKARPGDTLGASLSSNANILSYAWGTARGISDLGTAPTLTVPNLPKGSSIHLTARDETDQFSASVKVDTVSLPETIILAGEGEIRVDALGFLPLMSALRVVSGRDTLNIEVA